MVVIDLGFKIGDIRNKKGLNMRDQNVHTFFHGTKEESRNILEIWSTQAMGCLDSLHQINLFNFCAQSHHCLDFLELVEFKVPYLIDSSDKTVAEYIYEKKNYQGLNSIFSMVTSKKLPLDETTLFYGECKEPAWIIEQSEE